MKMILRSIFAAILISGAMPAWATEAGPKEVVENAVNAIIEVLDARTDKTQVSEEDRNHIRQAVEGRFDYQAMARRSLGRPWKKLEKQEQAHFTEVFRELLERSYGNRLSEYKGQTVQFADAEFKNDKARVQSTVIDDTREIPVDYRLHQTAGGWQVYDIRIEGTSLVRTFHQDFKSVLDNGNYEKLLKSLEEKIARLKEKDKA